MAQTTRFEKPYRVLDTAGNPMWTGHALCGTVYEIYTQTATAYLPGNSPAGTVATTSAGIAAGMAVVIDGTGAAGAYTTIPRWDYPLTDQAGSNLALRDQDAGVLYGIPCVSGSVGFLGVALQDIPARAVADPPGVGKGYVAGPGSITCVRSVVGAIAVGKVVQASTATSGSVMAAAAKDATTPAYGSVLGICLQTNTFAAPGTGTTKMVGIMVLPG